MNELRQEQVANKASEIFQQIGELELELLLLKNSPKEYLMEGIQNEIDDLYLKLSSYDY